MSARLESLAREKQGLLVRSSLSRLRLRRETRELRASLRWPGVAVSGLGRIGRFVSLAGRIAFYARLARSVLGKKRVAAA